MENENLKNNDLSDLVDLLNDCVENDYHFLQTFLAKFCIEKIGEKTLFNVLDCANLTAKQKSNSKKYLKQIKPFTKP
jgi:hypothetical protein